MRAIRRGEVDLNIILVCLGLPTEVPPIRRTGQGPVGMGVLAPGIPTRRLPVSQTGRAGMRDSGRQAAGERAGRCVEYVPARPVNGPAGVPVGRVSSPGPDGMNSRLCSGPVPQRTQPGE